MKTLLFNLFIIVCNYQWIRADTLRMTLRMTVGGLNEQHILPHTLSITSLLLVLGR